MWNDPIRDPWALGAVLLVGAAIFGPAAFMMGRYMFGRRKQETMTDQQTPPPAEPDERDPQTIVRDREMAGMIDHDRIEAVRGSLTNPERVPLRSPGGMADSGAATESFGIQRIGIRPDQVPQYEPAAVADEPPTLVQEQRWSAEGIPPLRNSPFGRVAAPQPIVSQFRIDCEHCGGRGFMPGINDLLTESVALLGSDGDEVVRLFYSSLLRAHPQLMTLFPGDPTQGDFGSDHKGAVQRDKLLKALTALAGLYDPGDEAKMAHLDQALGSFGRAHASFVRQDGTIKGATLEEYAAVKESLFTTLVTAAGAKWKPEYTEAWSQAYDYATAVMLAEQFRSNFAAPRFPRAGR